MNFRKTIAGITATLLAAGSFAALPMSAFAADTVETTEQYFTEGKIKEYIYAADKTADVECRFYAKTPNIPYISLSEYYKALNKGESLSIDKNEDGTYKLENIIGAVGIIDTDKDTFTTTSYESLVYPLEEANSESDLNKVFIETTGTEILGEPHAITIDFQIIISTFTAKIPIYGFLFQPYATLSQETDTEEFTTIILSSLQMKLLLNSQAKTFLLLKAWLRSLQVCQTADQKTLLYITITRYAVSLTAITVSLEESLLMIFLLRKVLTVLSLKQTTIQSL